MHEKDQKSPQMYVVVGWALRINALGGGLGVWPQYVAYLKKKASFDSDKKAPLIPRSSTPSVSQLQFYFLRLSSPIIPAIPMPSIASELGSGPGIGTSEPRVMLSKPM